MYTGAREMTTRWICGSLDMMWPHLSLAFMSLYLTEGLVMAFWVSGNNGSAYPVSHSPRNLWLQVYIYIFKVGIQSQSILLLWFHNSDNFSCLSSYTVLWNDCLWNHARLFSTCVCMCVNFFLVKLKAHFWPGPTSMDVTNFKLTCSCLPSFSQPLIVN